MNIGEYSPGLRLGEYSPLYSLHLWQIIVKYHHLTKTHHKILLQAHSVSTCNYVATADYTQLTTTEQAILPEQYRCHLQNVEYFSHN